LSVCLDSWAVIAWLESREPARSRLDELLDTAPVMSWVNAVEVYYRVARDQGREEADEALGDLRGVLTMDLPGPARMIEVGRLKSSRAIALGDCFAVATAAAFGLPLLTGDPEILGQRDLPCALEDLRPA
jgi:PIN domain nuclease of toxin-antitoxin system